VNVLDRNCAATVFSDALQRFQQNGGSQFGRIILHLRTSQILAHHAVDIENIRPNKALSINSIDLELIRDTLLPSLTDSIPL
jgi:hypothetical protein